MFKAKKILLGALIGTLALSSTMIIASANANKEEGSVNLPSFYNTTDYFKSNKYTNYTTANNGDNNQKLDKEDKLVKTTSKGSFYVNKNDLSFKFVTNDGKVHSSKVTKENADGTKRQRLHNGKLRDIDDTILYRASSPVFIQYRNAKLENPLSLQDKAFRSFDLDNFVEVEEATFDYVPNQDGFEAYISYPKLGIEFTLQVAFGEDDVTVRVPFSSIKENNEDITLATVSFYNYFGAVQKRTVGDTTATEDALTGYNFVPDGVGALVRYNSIEKNTPSNYRQRIYGDDDAMPRASTAEPMTSISMPVFGYVHGENHDGCLGIVEEGKEFCNIVSEHATQNIPFYKTYPEFVYREVYSQPTNSTGGTIAMLQEEVNEMNASVTYKFLEDEEASYVGMARTYRNYLKSKSMIHNTERNYTQIPLRVDTIGSEVTNGVMFDKRIMMTTFEEYADMLESLSVEHGISNVVGVYKGYTKDGVTWTSPDYDNIYRKMGSIDELGSLYNIYFHTDHVYASANQSGYNQSKDLTKSVNSQIISVGEGDSTKYVTTPEFTKEKMIKDTKKLAKKGVKSFALDSIGNVLHSNYGEDETTRSQTIAAYQEALAQVEGNVALYQPNDYLLQYTDRNFDYSMYTNQYLIFDDTVPFTSIVQSGSVELFSTYINFFGNVRDDLLRMVDYNVYPSFLLTKESSAKLDETALQYIYCSQYDNLEEAVNVYYNFVNESLKQVAGQSIENREIVADGVSKVTYSNGKVIYVNYTNVDQTVDGVQVPKKGHKVI